MSPDPSNDFEEFLGTIPRVTDISNFTMESSSIDSPKNWLVLSTDVVKSTQAVEQGKYRDIVFLSVATLVAASNAAASNLLYMFMGDGVILAFSEQK